MWRAAGGDPSKKPAKWREHESTREFVDYVSGSIVLPEDCEPFQALNESGEWSTWAHWQVGLAEHIAANLIVDQDELFHVVRGSPERARVLRAHRGHYRIIRQ